MRFPMRRARPGRSGLTRYLGDGEQTLLITRQHPFALIRAAIDTMALIVPLALAAWGIAGIELLRGAGGTWLLRIAFVVMLALVVRLAWRVLEWEFERVVVTDEKVIYVSGVLGRRIASTPLAKVSEFTVRQMLVGRLFDYGSLVVDVPGGRDDALHGLAFLPDPAGLYRLVSDRARRGRVSEGGGSLDDDAARDLDLSTAPRLVIEDTGRQAAPARPDPWMPVLEDDGADHTISIPRIPPPRA
jgi:hypothetical protein